jgi:acyl-coenzyme A thioesterase PaaI-like protein
MSENGNRDDYTPLPADESQSCFGCSPKNQAGLHMEFFLNQRQDTVVSWLSVPERFCGWGNIVHGGIISTILDEAMGWAALVLLRKLVISKSISVEFLKPVFIGKEIRVEGAVLDDRNDREVVMQGYIYVGEELCARSSSSYSFLTIEKIDKLGVLD